LGEGSGHDAVMAQSWKHGFPGVLIDLIHRPSYHAWRVCYLVAKPYAFKREVLVIVMKREKRFDDDFANNRLHAGKQDSDDDGTEDALRLAETGRRHP
jgi:hypothetical protein